MRSLPSIITPIFIASVMSLSACKESGISNPCDPTGTSLIAALLIKAAMNDQHSFCGIPGARKIPVIYVVGFKRITAGNMDWWIKKYDDNGNEDTTSWNKTYDGGANLSDNAYACAVDSKGNLYVGGTMDLGAGNENWWIKKFSPEGAEDGSKWNKTFDGGNSGNDQIYGMRVDASDNVYVVGRRSQAASNQDWWIKKFSSEGVEDTVNWNKTFNGPANNTDDPQDVYIAPDGSVYVVGEFELGATAQDMRIKKFSADGVEDLVYWNKSFDGGNAVNDIGVHVVVDQYGNVFVGGRGNRPGSQDDWWIKKFDSYGNEDGVNWNKFIDGGANTGEFLRSFAMDPAGNIFAGGRLDPTGTNAVWKVKKFSPFGIEDIGWDKSFDAQGTLLDDAFGMTTDSYGNVYTVGLCSRAASGEDWCIKKYNADGTEDTVNWNKMFDGGFNQNENAQAVCVYNKTISTL